MLHLHFKVIDGVPQRDMSLLSWFEIRGLRFIATPVQEPRVGTILVLADLRGAQHVRFLRESLFSHHVKSMDYVFIYIQRG